MRRPSGEDADGEIERGGDRGGTGEEEKGVEGGWGRGVVDDLHVASHPLGTTLPPPPTFIHSGAASCAQGGGEGTGRGERQEVGRWVRVKGRGGGREEARWRLDSERKREKRER